MNREEQHRTLLSVSSIKKNEEKRLPNCLKSVAFADEVLVVDSGSTDGTVALAKSFGVKVLVEAWRGYSQQKQHAFDACFHVISMNGFTPGPHDA